MTLSAITQGRFDATHQKSAMFDKDMPSEKLVRKQDLLVCRGNGNIKLVGCGRFPDADNNGLLFPDTMIGIPIDERKVGRQYFEFAWNSAGVRRQVERNARTTNGTHKVNQQVLKAISVQVPPRELQARFESVALGVLGMRARLESSEADNLFHSLVQRAFRGDL